MFEYIPFLYSTKEMLQGPKEVATGSGTVTTTGEMDVPTASPIPVQTSTIPQTSPTATRYSAMPGCVLPSDMVPNYSEVVQHHLDAGTVKLVWEQFIDKTAHYPDENSQTVIRTSR